MVMDSYWKKRLIVTVILVICAAAGYLGNQEDPNQETLLGEIALILNMGVFPLFGLYIYFWWKGRQERKEKIAEQEEERQVKKDRREIRKEAREEARKR